MRRSLSTPSYYSSSSPPQGIMAKKAVCWEERMTLRRAAVIASSSYLGGGIVVAMLMMYEISGISQKIHLFSREQGFEFESYRYNWMSENGATSRITPSTSVKPSYSNSLEFHIRIQDGEHFQFPYCKCTSWNFIYSARNFTPHRKILAAHIRKTFNSIELLVTFRQTLSQ